MEDFNFGDLTLDEATVSRVAHAEFLNSIKEWGSKMGMVLQPFIGVANILMEDEIPEDQLDKISVAFPLVLEKLVILIGSRAPIVSYATHFTIYQRKLYFGMLGHSVELFLGQIFLCLEGEWCWHPL